jgi:bifunctional UDP-N-acetylglucosamine pyrophosphorylase/glucosamine-1-phosphate N-acetyltransferase
MPLLSVVILGAGKGKRMVSNLPKVLHGVGDKPMLAHVLEAANMLDATNYFVVQGHGGELVRDTFHNYPKITWIEQPQQLGTGHAVSCALSSIADDHVVLVLYGDVPLIQGETLQPLIASARRGCLSVLIAELTDPKGYGRILRDKAGQVQCIVEEKDTTVEERCIREVSTGILAAPAKLLRAWINALDNNNSQGEYYLTDVIAMAVQQGIKLETFIVDDPAEVQGVNDRVQLAALERAYQRRQTAILMANGATLLDPSRVDVRSDSIVIGKDVVIDANVIFEGDIRLGDRVHIGPYSILRDVVLEDDSRILSHCQIEGARIGRGVQVGPFARLRPGAQLADSVRIGNFVEVKAASIGQGSKVNHLSYIGDAQIGADVNVGAGSITCNYDGAYKHKTIIEDRVFLGSNTALIAPIKIGENATIAAGSTINQNVPSGSLGIARAVQRIIRKWRRPVKKQTDSR